MDRSQCDWYLGNALDAVQTAYNEFAGAVDMAEGHQLWGKIYGYLVDLDRIGNDIKGWREQLIKEAIEMEG